MLNSLSVEIPLKLWEQQYDMAPPHIGKKITELDLWHILHF